MIQILKEFRYENLKIRFSRVGKNAFEILLERIKDKDHEKRVFEMHPEIVERSTVKTLN